MASDKRVVQYIMKNNIQEPRAGKKLFYMRTHNTAVFKKLTKKDEHAINTLGLDYKT